jgi:radical SAM family uncharacterized protein
MVIELERILPQVQKPGRYTGGEWNSIVKDWEATEVKVALAFPDIYDLGMSNLGLMILYDILNKEADVLAERVYAPWVDMEAAMRQAGLPLFSLETRHPLSDFDIIGFSLPYEQLYTNVLNMLDVAGIPLLAQERDERWPLVISGGSACYNPEPMADFIDAFVIGDGEEVILELVRAYQEWRLEVRSGRVGLLRRLARIPGVYVPRFYDVTYHEDGTVAGVTALVEDAALPVVKRIVPILPPPVTRLIVPFVDVAHNRATVEIQRGCTRGCRFCHAGMVYRPVRERPVAEVLRAIDDLVRETGFEEVSLLSLSSSDYSHIVELMQKIAERHLGRHLSISLPSLRIESFSVDVADILADGRATGFTFAPEAATERMRDIINKSIPDQELLAVAEEVYRRGWRTIKLYFMIGYPGERLDDVQAIVDLARQVHQVGQRYHGHKAQVNVSVSTLIPKPHTPFQWAPLDSEANIRAKQELLHQGLRRPGIKLSWNDPEETRLEALLSRGDRRLGQVIYRAWQLGAKFDAWGEHFKADAWRQACAGVGIDPDFYNTRPRSMDEVFPWDHISSGVRKSYLAEDYQMSLRGQTRPDCRERCTACGILPTFIRLRIETPAEAWGCPPVTPREERQRRANV